MLIEVRPMVNPKTFSLGSDRPSTGSNIERYAHGLQDFPDHLKEIFRKGNEG
jgi:hypothetical protein